MKKNCHGDVQHPDHSALLNRVNRAVGQLQGIGRMIEERRYCPDIISQVTAVKTALSSLQSALLKGHLEECVETALSSGKASERRAKIDELVELIKKLG